MIKTTSCPSAAVLADLMLGKVPAEQLAELSAHLEQCPQCQANAQALSEMDTLLEFARHDAQATREMIARVPPKLLETVKTIGAFAPANAKSTVALGANEDTPRATNLDFLAPPQQADELGRLGSYRILRVLGRGGMGIVFHAEDTRLQRSVAIKVMSPELAQKPFAKERFLREARAAAALEHDHIVPIYQVDEERGVPFIAMPLLRGQSLESWLHQQTGAIPVPLILKLGIEMAEGLAAAHACGLIHRDIKPGNIWLETRGASGGERGEKEDGITEDLSSSSLAPCPSHLDSRVKILDFGLARSARDSQGPSLTGPGVVLGTPEYIAPEQARGDSVDASADLFSLGVVLYRLCTGGLPFRGTNSYGTLMALAAVIPPAPHAVNAEIPGSLSDLVMKLLEKDPTWRLSSAREVVETLQAIKDQAGACDSGPQSVRAPVRRRWRLGVIAMVVLAAGLLGVWAFTQIRIAAEGGAYVINTDDPDISFQVNKGAVTLNDAKSKRKFQLQVLRHDKAKEEFELEVTELENGLTFQSKIFTIRRGEQVALKAWFERQEKKEPAKADGMTLLRSIPIPVRSRIYRLAISPDGTLVASDIDEPGFGADVVVWNAQTGKEAYRFRGPGPWLPAFTPDGKHFLFAKETALRIHDAATGAHVRSVMVDDWLHDFEVLPGSRHALCWDKKKIYLADLQAGMVAQTWPLRAGVRPFGPFTDDGKIQLLPTADTDTYIAWDLVNNRPSDAFAHLLKYKRVHHILPGNQQAIVAGAKSDERFLVDVADGKRVVLPGADWADAAVGAGAPLLDRRFDLFAFNDGKVQLLNRVTGKERASLQLPPGNLVRRYGVGVSADGRYACVAAEQFVHILRLPVRLK